MKYLFIFVLILFACSDEPQKKCTPFEVIISDALPIQFWQADCDTYNEKEVCGVHPKCWCQPWECDDEIPLQFTDTSELDYILRALDENNETIFELPFQSLGLNPIPESGGEITNYNLDPLAEWSQTTDIGIGWNGVIGLNVEVDLATAEISEIIYTDFEFQAGYDYEITLNYTVLDVTPFPFIYLVAYDDLLNEIQLNSTSVSSTGDKTITLSFTATGNETKVGVRVRANIIGGSNGEFRLLNTVTIEETSPIVPAVPATEFAYSASFTPSETTPGICNERIRLEIVNVTASPENVVAKSDCLDIRQSHACTNVIEYFNNLNLDGLIYEDISPVTTFRIRVPSIFFHEKFVEEDNVIKLTSSIVKTSSSLEAQRLFETDYAPYYWHRKLQLIFKHQNIAIDGQNWVKREAYEIQEGDRRWPLKKAKVYLNEADYSRAVL